MKLHLEKIKLNLFSDKNKLMVAHIHKMMCQSMLISGKTKK